MEGGAMRKIFSSISKMVAQKKKIDLILVTEWMHSNGVLEAAGGPAVITDAFTFVPTSANFDIYLDMVIKNAAVRSSMIEIEKLKTDLSVCVDTEDVRTILCNAFKKPVELLRPPAADDTDRNLLNAYIDAAEARAQGDKQTTFSTPFDTINRKAGGTAPGEVTGILGLPSSGKSIFGKQMALHNMLEHGMPTMVITGEMPYQQWMDRAICEMGMINFKSLRSGQLNQIEQNSLCSTIARISKQPLYIYDRKRIRMELAPIEAAIRREAKMHGIKCVIVDYLQLIKSPAKGKRELRTDQEIGEVSAMLKDMAVNYGLHVIALCAESDDGKIRNSREPEYDFDNIIKLITRTDKNPRSGNPMIVTDKMLITKWRDSERGYVINVEMAGQYCRFKDVTGPNM